MPLAKFISPLLRAIYVPEIWTDIFSPDVPSYSAAARVLFLSMHRRRANYLTITTPQQCSISEKSAFPGHATPPRASYFIKIRKVFRI